MKSITETDQKLVDETRTRLLEHFDSVHIFVTKHNGGDAITGSYEAGGGNFYAQLGQIEEWLEIQHEFHRCHGRRKDAE